MEQYAEVWKKACKILEEKNPELNSAFRKIMAQSNSRKMPTLSFTHEQRFRELLDDKIELMHSKEWKLRISSKTINVRKQVDRVLAVLELVKGLVSQAAVIDPVHVGLPLAALSVILSWIGTDKDNRDSLFDGLDIISGKVRKYAMICNIYFRGHNSQDKARLEEQVVIACMHILEFEARAVCQCSRNIAHQTFRNLFGRENWSKMLASIEQADIDCMTLLPLLEHDSQADFSQRLIDLNVEQNRAIDKIVDELQQSHKVLIAELEKDRAQRSSEAESKKETACLEKLRSTFGYDSLKNQSPDRDPGTCEWFLTHSNYQRWLSDPEIALLWLTADPGCGKSVLARYLVDDFTDITQVSSHVCYFFFKSGTDADNAIAALCAILHQLFSQDRDLLRKYGLPQYERNGDKLASLLEPLWEMFEAICHDTNRKQIVCVIDALDECNEQSMKILCKRIVELCVKLPSELNAKFFITSRPYAFLRATIFAVTSKDQICMIEHNADDADERKAIQCEIDMFIDRRMEEFKTIRERHDIFDSVHETLLRKIKSMDNYTYLWCSLVCAHLCENAADDERDLLRIVESLPQTVDETYQRILSRVSVKDVDAAKKLLSIILSARNDLTLTELLIAFSIDNDGQFDDPKTTNMIVFGATTRRRCGLFVRFMGDRVVLIHLTARTFLLQSLTQPRFADVSNWVGTFTHTRINFVLALSCIRYLTSSAFSETKHSSASNLRLGNLTKKYPFVVYASTRWALHLQLSNVNNTEPAMAQALKLCDVESSYYKVWSKVFWAEKGRRPPRTSTSLAVVASLDIIPLLERILSDNVNINGQDEDGDTALHTASLHGCEKAALVLIQSGASTAIPALDGNTPLHSAAARGMASIISAILDESRASIERPNLLGQTALHRAAQWGHLQAVQVLVKAGSELNAVDHQQRTPLHAASLLGVEAIKSRKGDEADRFKAVIRFLCRAGADTTIEDQENLTPLATIQKVIRSRNDIGIAETELSALFRRR